MISLEYCMQKLGTLKRRGLAQATITYDPLSLQIALKVLASEQRNLQEMERENATFRGLHATVNQTAVPSQPKEKNTLLCSSFSPAERSTLL